MPQKSNLLFIDRDQNYKWTQTSVFLFPRPSICSSKRHLFGQWDICEFRVGSAPRYRRTQRPAVQRVVSEMLRGRGALWEVCILPRRRQWREGRGEYRSRGRRDCGAFGQCSSSIRSPPGWVDRALGDCAQPGGSHQLLLPHHGYECSDTPEQRAVTLCYGQHHNEPGR